MQSAPLIQNSMPLAERPEITKQSLADLQKAFSAFTDMSEQLSDSYHVLEKRVVELSGELASLSEQRLHELNEKEQIAEQLESLLRLMPAAVIVLDNKGVIRQANPAAEKWIANALSQPENLLLQGRPWAQIVRLAFAPKQTDYHEISLRDGRLVSLETSPLDNSGQLILMTDQTETRSLQAKVSRQERLTAMGQMVASLAHQVRTPLSAALLYASNLKNPKLTEVMHDQFVDKLVGRLNHLEKQVQDMLLFVKGEAQLINRLSVSAIFDLLMDATAAIPAAGSVDIQWQNEVPEAHIQCQSDVLISAFMNVINNSLEAGQGKYQLRISAQPKGSSIEFSFSDSGPGMDQQQLQKIKEPFFTTKSYGTGLGIPVLVATVKAHHGELDIQSEPGRGTDVLVTLPVYTER